MASEMTDDLWQLIERGAHDTPDAVLAIDQAGAHLTAGALAARAERLAAGLAARGVGDGTVVSWQLPNRLESFVVTAALARLGAVQNPLVPILRSREVSFICREAGTSMLIVPKLWRGFDYAAMAAPIAEELGLDLLIVDFAVTGLPASGLPDSGLPASGPPSSGLAATDAGLPFGDPSSLSAAPSDPTSCRWIFYTSGTTADPKGARHRDRSIMVAAHGLEQAVELDHHDRMAYIAPITHVGGIILFAAALRTGCTNLVLESFEVAATVEFFRDHGVTLVGMGTPMFTAYLAHQRAHPHLAPLFPAARAFLSGGAPTPPALHHQIRAELGTVGVVSGWGLTECPMLTWNTTHDSDEELATTEGRAVPGAHVVAVRPDGTLAAPGEEGELRATAEQLMLGYVDAALDADAFDEAGRFRTGDLGVIDAHGFVRITGRLKDIIIRNMENISALELEQLLFSHPDIRDVAVIGVPDERTGERVAAAIVAEGDQRIDLDQLRAHLRAQGISDRKFPELLAYVDELPRNAMGKVIKAELRPLFTSSAR